jgi:hypothetical protein
VKQDIWVLYTIGTNMLDVLGLDYIDPNRTYSNDIIEIFNVLGMEAARQAIYNELADVIEFDGTYYHRSTPENSLREEKRDKMILESGYQVLHVSEYDYKNDKQKIIDKCVAFLNKK